MDIFINPLSVNSQHNTIFDCARSIRAAVDCFNCCLIGINLGRIRLHYDTSMDTRHLIGNESLAKTIGSVQGIEGRHDTIRLWYLYTKNRAFPIPVREGIQIEISDKSGTEAQAIQAPVDHTVFHLMHHWISIPGVQLFDCRNLLLQSQGDSKSVINISQRVHMEEALPRYEANPKHHKEPYFSNGEYVSPMPLDDEVAQRLLFESILEGPGGPRWALHRQSNRFYCFRETHPGRLIYHGFMENEANVPLAIAEELRNSVEA